MTGTPHREQRRADGSLARSGRPLPESGGGGNTVLPAARRAIHPVFVLFVAGILAYGAGSAWYVLARFDLVNLIRDQNEEDAFYYFQIARNLAEGKFSTFDGGITRTNGYHPPLAVSDHAVLLGIRQGSRAVTLSAGFYGNITRVAGANRGHGRSGLIPTAPSPTRSLNLPRSAPNACAMARPIADVAPIASAVSTFFQSASARCSLSRTVKA